MKNFNIYFHHCSLGLLIVLQLISINLPAQGTSTIYGKIYGAKNNEPVPFATIRFIEVSDTALHQLKGIISDENGSFTIDHIQNGKYKLQISSVGFKKAIKTVEIVSSGIIDAGTIILQDSSLLITEAVITADRIKGKSENGKTIYYVNSKLLSASGSSPELLRHIPGVQVDLKHNISMDGSPGILLFVDGKERDRSYVSQLNPSQIDRIEVVNTPPSNYDGDASGVINIVLKEEKEVGINGHLFSELPSSNSVVYIFPTYSLNCSYNKINLYTSYNGEVNYEDIDEITNRQIPENSSFTDLSSIQQVRQKNLSHKFHYGIDYHLSKRDILNFYGFYRHYSYEQDGNVVVKSSENTANNWEAQKEETDLNRNNFNSLYYKHLFDDKGCEIAIDISYASNRSENEVTYNNHLRDGTLIYTNTENPKQRTSSVKIDFSTPSAKKIKWSTGAKMKINEMKDNTTDAFSYTEQTNALYGALNYKRTKFDLNIGVRVENAKTEINNSQNNSSNLLLPYAAFHYKVNEYNDLYLSFRSSVRRPSVYLLNRYTYTDNPYTIRQGNPLLIPERKCRLQCEHSIRFKSNYISSRLFYETVNDAINKLSYINDRNLFVTQTQNLGSIHQYGLQLSGALKMGMLTINSSFRLYNQSTRGNSLAKQYEIENKNNRVMESGISTILSFSNDFALSVIFQYATAKENIQDNTYSEALYFISLDKTFQKKLKAGIVSALPFAKNFIYQGSAIHSPNFSSTYTGNLKLPTIPLMFRLSYQFGTGLNRANIKREKENVDTRPKQGF